jgi:tetratricopeptide (TPR) repeat protein
MEPVAGVFEKLLELLRTYGWDIGLQKLKAQAHHTPDDERRALLEQFRGWMAAERGEYPEAIRQLQRIEQVPFLAGWAVYGQAFVAMRRKDFPGAHSLLDRAAALADPTDTTLRSRLALVRAITYFHQGQDEPVLPYLHEALELAGPDGFSTGRVLDALGMVCAARDNFGAACTFYERALGLKQLPLTPRGSRSP